MRKNVFLIITLLSTVLSSCYKDIDMEKYRPEPDLVLNGIISADTMVMLSISRTKFFTDTSRYEIVTDANVSLFVNDTFREHMEWVTNESFYGGGIYASNYKSKTGDRIRVEAKTMHGTAWVEETVPSKVGIENLIFSHKLIYDNTGFNIDENGNIVEIPTLEITYQITFTDKADEMNFYFIRIDNPNPPFDDVGNFDYSLDPVFVEQVSVIDGLFGDKTIHGQGGRSFTDHLINGECYTLVVRETLPSGSYDYAPSCDRRIILYAITESYYKYLSSMQMSADAANSTNLSTFGFAEPVRIFTNVNGGVGIMATSQHDTVSLNLKDILSNN